jgi:Xaa-Pro aminopeptidase
MSSERVHVRSLLQDNRVEAFCVTQRENIRYLAGFTGSAGILLITSRGGTFITDSRYAAQSEREVTGFRIQVLNQGEKLLDRVARLLKKKKVTRLGFEPGDLRYQSYLELKSKVKPVRLIPMKKGVETLRLVKSEDEVEKIQRAVQRAEKAFKSVRRDFRAGVKERDIALAMENTMRQSGAACAAFDTIVASGERSAMPHGIASEKRLKMGEFVVVDFGAECDGYFSDMTRTLYLGKRLTGKKRQIYDTVHHAQEAAIDKVKPGRKFEEIDRIARNVIQKSGFGPFFGHGTGHGIGLEVHERPYVAPKSRGIIREGMVFTIEPGIYVPGVGGVRIEDMVLVTQDGCRSLTRLPKDWRE